DQIGLVEAREPVREEDGVVGEQLELGAGRRERRGMGWVPVDDGADVGAARVDAGVDDRLQVEHGVRIVDRDDVVRLDLVERDALALDPDLALRPARADVPERQVGVPLERDDPARDRDLLPQALGDGNHQRRSVGGYSGCGKPKTMTTSASPVFATACHVSAGMWSASPARNGTGPPSSLSSPAPATTYATSSVSCRTGASSVPGVKTE